MRNARMGVMASVACAAFASLGEQDPGARRITEQAAPAPRARTVGTPQPPGSVVRAPYALPCVIPVGPPLAGAPVSVPEYAPARGVLLAWVTGEADTVVTDLVAELTRPGYSEIAYVVVNASQQSVAASAFAAAGADMGKVVFLNAELDSPWMRDYGPHFVQLGGAPGGALAVVDSHYHQDRPNDNFIPNQIAEDFFKVPLYYQGLYYSGGNFLASEDLGTGNGREAYVTSRVFSDNPPAEGFDAALIGELYQKYSGINTLNVFPQLPATVDQTGHLDTWMSLVDSSNVVISEFSPGSNATAIQITNDAATYMAQKGYVVTRTPAWLVGGNETQPIHFSYANALRANDRILIPAYGSLYGVGGNPEYDDEDAAALAAWQTAAPGAEIVPIQCASIIAAGGALHSLTKQIPAHTSPIPSVQIVWPTGGEWLKIGQTYTIRWAADDDVAVTGVDLYYSTDGGATYPHVIALNEANDSQFDWTVPNTPSGALRVRLTAHDADSNAAVSASSTDATITGFARVDLTFKDAAGVFHFGRGYETESWSQIDGTLLPVIDFIDEFDPDAYLKLSASDANGINSPGNANRYESPLLNSTQKCTHLYRFLLLEDPNKIRDIEVHWEGYTDNCTQTELYVWDGQATNWGNGAGLAGQNRYLNNHATRGDRLLTGRITSDFSRYIVGTKVSLLVYSARPSEEQYADFVRVRVIFDDTAPPCPEDCDGDGSRDQVDLALLLSCYNTTACCDITKDGITDQADLAALLAVYNQLCPE